MTHAPASQRIQNFNEVQLGYDEIGSRREAKRCLECGVCSECYQCVSACLAGAVDHSQKAIEKEIEIGSLVLCPERLSILPAWRLFTITTAVPTC